MVLHPSGHVLLRVMDFNVVGETGTDVVGGDSAVEHVPEAYPNGDDRLSPGPATPAGNDTEMMDAEVDGEQLPMLPLEGNVMEDDGDDDWVDEDEDEEEDEEEGIANMWRAPAGAADAVAGFGSLRTGSKGMSGKIEKRQMADVATYVEDPAVFVGRKLETSLPFRWMWRNAEETRRFSRVMIDNEHIIGLRVSVYLPWMIMGLVTDLSCYPL